MLKIVPCSELLPCDAVPYDVLASQVCMREFPGFEHIHLLTDPLSKHPMCGRHDVKMDSFGITRASGGNLAGAKEPPSVS